MKNWNSSFSRRSPINASLLVLVSLSLSCSSQRRSELETAIGGAPNSNDIHLAGGVDNPVVADSSGDRSPASVPSAPNAPKKDDGHAKADTPKPEAKPRDGAVTCGIRIDQLAISPGSSYTILDVLNRRISPAQAMAAAREGKTLDVGTFSGSADVDMATLEPWFGGVLSGPKSEIDDAAQTTKAYARAMAFLHGATPPFRPVVEQNYMNPQMNPGANPRQQRYPNQRLPSTSGLSAPQRRAMLAGQQNGAINPSANRGQPQYWQNDDFSANAKMTAVLAAMFATASDPECTRYIRKLANTVLPAPIAAELDDLPIIQAAESVHDGTIDAYVKKLTNTRHDLENQQKAITEEIATKEKSADFDKEQIQTKMERTYRTFIAKLGGLAKKDEDGKSCRAVGPKCARAARARAKEVGSIESEDDFLKGLLADCRAEVRKGLKAETDNVDRLRDKGAKYDDELSSIKDEPAVVSGQEKDINEQLKQSQICVAKLDTALDWINGVGEDSVLKEKNAMDDYISQRNKLNSPDYFQDENRRYTEIQQRLDADAKTWLTNAYASGTYLPESWRNQYRKPQDSSAFRKPSSSIR